MPSWGQRWAGGIITLPPSHPRLSLHNSTQAVEGGGYSPWLLSPLLSVPPPPGRNKDGEEGALKREKQTWLSDRPLPTLLPTFSRNNIQARPLDPSCPSLGLVLIRHLQGPQ